MAKKKESVKEGEKKSSSSLWDVGQAIAAATAAAFVISCADLLGRYMALGAHFSRFLTVQDVLSNAIWVTPPVFIGVAYLFVARLVAGPLPSKEVSLAQYQRARWLIVIYLLIGSIVFYTLPPWTTFFLVILLVLIFWSLLKVVRLQVSAEVVDESAIYLTVIIFMLMSFFTLGYSLTIADVRTQQQTHKICLSDSCHVAQLFDEISAGLVLRWKDADVLSLIPMSEVHSVSALQPRSMKPMLDVFGFGDGQPRSEKSPSQLEP